MMKGEIVESVEIRLRCPGCGANGYLRAAPMIVDGPVVIFEPQNTGIYCNCEGGGNTRHKAQIVVSMDPEKRPVMKIVPVGESIKAG